MPIRIPHLGLAIYTSPKVLSTSLKYLAFELENDRPFDDFVIAGRQVHVHSFYPAERFKPVNKSEYPHVVAFVRDPVKRFVSMFRHRVAIKHGQSAEAWRKAIQNGLPESPSFSDFLARFDDYSSQIEEIRHHAAPQVEYLGSDAEFYNRIFTEQSVSQFEQFIQGITGQSLRLPWEHKSANYVPVSLDNANLAWIRERYLEDYETFEDYFSPNTSISGLGLPNCRGN